MSVVCEGVCVCMMQLSRLDIGFPGIGIIGNSRAYAGNCPMQGTNLGSSGRAIYTPTH